MIARNPQRPIDAIEDGIADVVARIEDIEPQPVIDKQPLPATVADLLRQAE